MCICFLFTLSKNIRSCIPNQSWYEVDIKTSTRSKRTIRVTLMSGSMFMYIFNKQLEQSAAWLIELFLNDLHFKVFSSLKVIPRSNWNPLPLKDWRIFIYPTIFFVFDKKLTLHIRKGQSHIWEALYGNILLTLPSFWSFFGCKIFSIKFLRKKFLPKEKFLKRNFEPSLMSCSSLIHNLLNPIVIQSFNHPKYKIQLIFS